MSPMLPEAGLSRAMVTLLYKETAQKVDLDALDKLCKLFDCGIGELLERTTQTTNKRQSIDRDVGHGQSESRTKSP